MADYPFYVQVYISRLKRIKILGLDIGIPKILINKVAKLNPVYWATNYYKEDEFDDYYCYDYSDDYYEDDDDYYCYDNCDNYYEDDDEIKPGLLDSHYYNQLLICSSVQRINGYTALASQHILIADIDCGNDIKKPLQILEEYVSKNNACFKAYKTLNGMRYIQLDTIYQTVNRSAIDTLKYLGSDPKYIEFCRVDERFMARVTPKTNSEGMKKYLSQVIRELKTEVKTSKAICCMGDTTKIDPATDIFVTIHDRLTNVMEGNLPLG